MGIAPRQLVEGRGASMDQLIPCRKEEMAQFAMHRGVPASPVVVERYVSNGGWAAVAHSVVVASASGTS